jgi:pimeloyl-ACP methyl ester carboxylesterase/class 3 adenylate cyclase
METIRTQYAKSGDVHIAYQVFGEGDVDLVFAPGFVSHIENYWDEPGLARWLKRLGSFTRVIMFDKRGTGLSDRVSELPGLDERIDDVHCIMDHVGIQRAAIFGVSEGGSLSTLFAATHPDRTLALILYGAFARFSDWFPTQETLDTFYQYVDNYWGSGASLPIWSPTKQDDPVFQQWWGKFERLGASPGAANKLMQMNSQIDISDILPTVNVPTLVIHRRDDINVSVEGGRMLARDIPGAKYVELSGNDHLPMVGENSDQILDEIAHFLTGEHQPVDTDRILATVLFTDIVDSTKHLAQKGDQQWRHLLASHNTMVERQIGRFRGRLIKNTGDGILAVFDGPARAIRCAMALCEEAHQIGIELRTGLHTGEIELMGDDVGGMAVHIAARVMGKAGAGGVWVSRTLKDLVVGSGFSFKEQGVYTLKGVPEEWRLFSIQW